MLMICTSIDREYSLAQETSEHCIKLCGNIDLEDLDCDGADETSIDRKYHRIGLSKRFQLGGRNGRCNRTRSRGH